MSAWRAMALSILVLGVGASFVSADHPQSDSGKVVVFDHLGGNPWWVEARLAGQDGGQVQSLWAAPYPGSTWTQMSWNPSWGKWTASMHVPDGSPVKFRAHWAGGAQQLSCWFSHPQGVEACGGPGTSTSSSTTPTTSSSTTSSSPPSTFDATFTNVRGNEWWQQASVNGNQPISKVDVKLNDGAWKPVTKHSWGWGVSYHAPQGTIVQFRATSTTGATDLSHCYQWLPPSGQNAPTTSCPGTNPSPPEEVPPPRSTPWHQSTMAEIGGNQYIAPLLSIGDANRDGKPELDYAGEALMAHETDGVRMVSSLGDWTGLAVGDGDGDGKQEVYAIRQAPGQRDELHRFSYDGTRWNAQLLTFGWGFEGPLTVGDLDGDGKNEVYAGIQMEPQGTCCAAGIVRVEKTGPDSWGVNVIAEFGNGGYFLDVHDLWIGDADNDGRNELAVLLGGRDFAPVLIVEREAGQWRQSRILGSAGPYAGDVAIGDADGNGRQEVIVASDLTGHVTFLHHQAGTWQAEVVDTNIARGFVQAFVADADNDGRADLYLGGEDARIYQMKREAEGWRLSDLGKVGDASVVLNDMVAGNGDGVAGNELYLGTYDWDTGLARVTKMSKAAPAPQPTFDAQFSNVKGNNWWAEVVVTANGPVNAVMLIIDCDTSKDPADMTYRADWGKWVLGNTHVPTGAKVTFWAHGNNGSEHSGGYVWPHATPTAGC